MLKIIGVTAGNNLLIFPYSVIIFPRFFFKVLCGERWRAYGNFGGKGVFWPCMNFATHHLDTTLCLRQGPVLPFLKHSLICAQNSTLIPSEFHQCSKSLLSVEA